VADNCNISKETWLCQSITLHDTVKRNTTILPTAQQLVRCSSFYVSRSQSPGRPRTRPTWMNTIQQDLKSSNLSLDEAIDVAQNHPLRGLMSTFGATHSQWCMPEMKKKKNNKVPYC